MDIEAFYTEDEFSLSQPAAQIFWFHKKNQQPPTFMQLLTSRRFED
jgi:hypothetical protein